MDKEEFLEMGKNPDFIPGIYNYCDRWCERCAYTSNCFLFATQRQQFPDEDSRDISNKKFWDNMEDLFRISFELLEDAAEKFDIDWEKVDDTTNKESITEKRESANSHPAAQKSSDYLNNVNIWFEESDLIFEQKGEELAKLAVLELPKERLAAGAVKIKDFVEIIRWYQHQIYVKTMRALQGKVDAFIPEDNPAQTDFNGSAKVALIGIERSIAAWGGLLKTFPDEEDSILQLLVLLQQTQKLIETEFPNARDFVRPGFDE